MAIIVDLGDEKSVLKLGDWNE